MHKYLVNKTKSVLFSQQQEAMIENRSEYAQTSFMDFEEQPDRKLRTRPVMHPPVSPLNARNNNQRFSAPLYVEDAAGNPVTIGQLLNDKIVIDVANLKHLGFTATAAGIQRQTSFTTIQELRTIEQRTIVDDSIRQGSPLPGSENSRIHSHGWNTSPILSPTVAPRKVAFQDRNHLIDQQAERRESLNDSFVTCRSFASVRDSPVMQQDTQGIPEWMSDSSTTLTGGGRHNSFTRATKRVFLDNLPSIVLEPQGRKVNLKVLAVIDPDFILCGPPANYTPEFDECSAQIRQHCLRTEVDASFLPRVLEVVLAAEGLARKDWFRAVVVRDPSEVAGQDWVSIIKLDGKDKGKTANIPLQDIRPIRAEFCSRLNLVICGLKGIRPKNFVSRPRSVWSAKVINTLSGWIKGAQVEIEVLDYVDCVNKVDLAAKNAGGRELNIRRLLIKQGLAERAGMEASR